MAAAKPWMKFYPRDWRADEKLRLCSYAARGLWIEMMSLMHSSERYGRLLVNGKPPTVRQLAALTSGATDEVEALVDELREAGVFSTDANGVIYSRRMKTDEKAAENARRNGKRGGNPKLCNTTGNSGADKQPDNAEDKDGLKLRGQRPENREESKSPPNPPSLPEDVRAVLEAGGYASPPGDIGLLRQWYAAGADLSDVTSVLRKEAAQLMNKGQGAPRTLKVFDGAVREKLAADQREIEHLRKVARRNMDEPQAAAGGQS